MYKRLFPFALICLVFMSVLIMGCPPRQLVSVSQEVEIGREASREIEARYPVEQDPERNALVNGIGQHLVQFSGRQDIEWTFRILDLRDVNAVSLPGGWIYVYNGLINETAGDVHQLAGVIGHEIGHVDARHHADLIGRQFYAALLIGTLTRGQVTQIASIIANIQLLRWSRRHELEADRLGIDYTFASPRYEPEGLIEFFARLLEAQPREPGEFEQIFRTHPVTSERIERAEAHLAELRAAE